MTPRKKPLHKRFEPDSKRQLYAAEFHSRRRRRAEQWGDFADALHCLADKAFPTLGEEAKALLALDRYLGELDDTKVAFAVRQGRPKTLEEAVAATLEMESYLSHGQKKEAGVSVVHEQMDGGQEVDTACANREVLPLLDAIVARLERLETDDRGSEYSKWKGRATSSRGGPTATHGKPTKPVSAGSSQMASRPLVLPDSFSGEGNWSQWIYHFENVAEVNEWEDAKRVLWLKVRLTGRAQIAYQQLSDITRANYGDTKKALKERFEPASQTARYLAEFENRRKKKTEGWADFAEDLRSLVEKAYPALQEEAKAQIALSHYLRHLDQPMTSFSVKQRTPKSLDEAVSATLEIESYQIGLPKIESGAVGVPLMDSKTHPEVEEAEIGTVASRSSSQLQDGLVHQLLQRLDKIEQELRRPERERDEKASDGQRSPRSVTCWNCGRRGHVSRECYKKQRHQENSKPSAHHGAARTGDSFANRGHWGWDYTTSTGRLERRLKWKTASLDSKVPVCLLNPRDVPVTMYKGMTIGEIEELRSNDVPVDNVQKANTVTKLDPKKRQMLLSLAETIGAHVSKEEQVQFSNLLLDQPVRRLPPHRKEQVNKLLHEMQENDIIHPSSSPWASPIVLVQKKDESVRFCIDYRKLNAVTTKDAYPLPRIDDTLDTLCGSKWFSTLDLLSGYWQVEMSPEDRHKTAFCTPQGLFEFKVMPFGLCNAPATFQRLMDLVLAGLQWSKCLVYLDDVILLGTTFGEHLDNIRAVFDRIRQGGLKLRADKCCFLQRNVKYLGHLVGVDGLQVDPDKVGKVASWPVPQSAQQVQQFLGFANYYRRFIQGFAEVAKPLHRLTEHAVNFSWTAECQEAFENLRSRLTRAPILAFPDYTLSFVLDTDASDLGIGAVLSQVSSLGQEQVVAYGSRLLSKAERNYSVTRRELLAVVTFTRLFRPYLLGRCFTVRTDHSSLQWIQNFKEPEGQLARWLEQLQEYDFEVIHRKGRNHNNADALSRLSEGDSPQSNNITVVSIDSPVVEKRKVMREEQLQDDVVGPVLKAVESDLLPKKDELKQFSIGTRRLFQLWDQLKVKGGVLHRNFVGTKEVRPCLQLVVPMSQRKIVLAELHEGVTGGHLGQEKTLMKLKERFYWPGHWNDVQNWCNTCAACISRKTPAPKQRASLQSILVGQPMQLVAVDILGPLPESGNGNSYILVVGDYFTRWMEAYPIQNQEAVTVAQKLVDEIFCRFSVPEQLHSDQGRQFESAVIKEICNLLHIEKTRTTAYHPQSDGLVERFNRTLLSMLTTCGRSHPFEWEDHIRKVCFAYNTSVQATTGYSPFFLMFDRQARLPIDLMYGTECGNSVTKTVPEYVTKLSEAFVEAYAAVRDTMGAKLQRQKEFYNKKVHGDPHKPGDFVLLFNPAVPKGGSRKFHSPWTGPFKIVERVSEATYHIQNTVDGKTSIVHFDRLKRCRPDIRTNIKQTKKLAKKDNSPTCGSTAGKDPPGTHMELLDDDQPTHVPEHPQPNAVLNEDPEPEEGPEQDDDDPHIIVPQPGTATRYPTRQRRAPDYY
eukprot:Em0022g896a